MVASDADGDSLTLSYAWTVDGAAVANVSGNVLDSSHFVKLQTISVTVTATDSAGNQATASGSVSSVNSAPSTPVVSISPNPPGDDDDLICSYTGGSDADGDAVTVGIEWYVDGGLFSGASTTAISGDTIDSVDTAELDSWQCRVTATDGIDTVSGTAQVQVVYEWPGTLTFDCINPSARNLGPSQADCDSQYAGTDLDGQVTVSNGKQLWTVPISGTYGITAEAGSALYGEFYLSQGTTLQILVPQSGSCLYTGNCSGSGAAFVVSGSNTPMMIAAGRGGNARDDYNNCGQCYACPPMNPSIWGGGVGTRGRTSSYTPCLQNQNQTLGQGGSGASSNGGGAGFSGNGGGGDCGGKSWHSGGQGGSIQNNFGVVGGFGGGGCFEHTSSQIYRGAGGGAGYSGGNGYGFGGGAGGIITQGVILHMEKLFLWREWLLVRWLEWSQLCMRWKLCHD